MTNHESHCYHQKKKKGFLQELCFSNYLRYTQNQVALAVNFMLKLQQMFENKMVLFPWMLHASMHVLICALRCIQLAWVSISLMTNKCIFCHFCCQKLKSGYVVSPLFFTSCSGVTAMLLGFCLGGRVITESVKTHSTEWNDWFCTQVLTV